MKTLLKLFVIFLILSASLPPSAQAKLRRNVPGGAEGVPSNPPAAAAATPAPEPATVSAVNGQCPANYRCSQCAHI